MLSQAKEVKDRTLGDKHPDSVGKFHDVLGQKGQKDRALWDKDLCSVEKSQDI